MLLIRKKFPALLLSLASLLCFSIATPSFAQDWHGPDHGGPGGPPGDRGGPMEHSFRGGEHGRWWDNPHLAQQIGLTDDQKAKMDDIFQQHRLQLIDLNATLQKDEVILHPLLQADQLDEAKILSQIDAIAQARADLEKANARMLFGIRKVLTPDQWKKLQTLARNGPPHMDGNRRDWRTRRGGAWHGPNGPKPPDGPTGPDGGTAQPAPPPTPPGE
jgi:Spy/CpxP family protein refolding chaperone